MAKLSLVDVANLSGNPVSAQNNINSNSAAIEAAIENTLSRDGATPNQMNAQIDMNSNEIINLGVPSGDNSAARLKDVKNTLGSGATAELVVTFDNTGSVISTGATKTYFRFLFPGIIQSYLLTLDRVGSMVVDIWKSSTGVPTIANTITGSTPPTVSAAQFGGGGYAGGPPMTGWTTAFLSGDVLEFSVVSAATVQKAVLCIQLLRT